MTKTARQLTSPSPLLLKPEGEGVERALTVGRRHGEHYTHVTYLDRLSLEVIRNRRHVGKLDVCVSDCL